MQIECDTLSSELDMARVENKKKEEAKEKMGKIITYNTGAIFGAQNRKIAIFTLKCV